MTNKKLIYVRFEQPNYIGTKSELLKTQMEILYLKKMIKNLALTRAKKSHYRQMLEETFLDLRKKIDGLDILMPEDKISIQEYSKVNPKKRISHPKIINPIKNPEVLVKKDEIEDELMKIKRKLDLLNKS